MCSSREACPDRRDTRKPLAWWWLLCSTDWLTHNISLECLFLPTRDITTTNNYVRHRIEVIPILGNELAAKFPGAFEFYYLPPDKLTVENIQKVLAQLLS